MYLWKAKIILLSSGERFATCVDESGVPAYYPTLYALKLRSQSKSLNTMLQYAKFLTHFERICMYNNYNIINEIHESRYPTEVEADWIIEGSSIAAQPLAQYTSANVTKIAPRRWSRADWVENNYKSQRLTVYAEFINMVCTLHENSEWRRKPRNAIRQELSSIRKDTVEYIKAHRPRLRDVNRVAGISHDQLGRLTRYLMQFEPHEVEGQIWENPALNERNWAIARLLLETGIRNSELRQLKFKDLNLNQAKIIIHRRPDDPEDPRLHEPNAKTRERIITISNDLCQFIENYTESYGSEAADHSNSPFVFLSHSNNNYGQPIGTKTVKNIAASIGNYLDIHNLTPHHFRHSWIQNLADWSIHEGIEPADFDRFANYLGGWSMLSQMASKYRGDQLTKYAYEQGLRVGENRE